MYLCAVNKLLASYTCRPASPSSSSSLRPAAIIISSFLVCMACTHSGGCMQTAAICAALLQLTLTVTETVNNIVILVHLEYHSTEVTDCRLQLPKQTGQLWRPTTVGRHIRHRIANFLCILIQFWHLSLQNSINLTADCVGRTGQHWRPGRHWRKTLSAVENDDRQCRRSVSDVNFGACVVAGWRK